MTAEEVREQWRTATREGKTCGPRQQRGRPSCPCGFVGGTRNIIGHRLSCPEWTAWWKGAAS